ncbi:sensor histidine kinase [Rickettsiales endosymbiont of Stachyamoeba lipophora]|uniref:sensor histidine kinase n=1 Tax=Rickettsiales endosymbiont of Stachyamoeba lipophora TaxID=2486578 RepID=UPI000F6503C8|nr:PAS-domain containing protein [Rickettsiales endosymbiont of Stachyamoeba lipophora]AZL15380.1 PAS domain-containing protein [Rickettsiales endosymbiont of Stachyamoeba lipophora]
MDTILTYHYLIELGIVFSFLLFLYINKLFQLKRLKTDFFKFQQIYEDIPNNPKCAFIYYQSTLKKLSCSPTFIKLFNLQEAPESLAQLSELNADEIIGQIFNFCKKEIAKLEQEQFQYQPTTDKLQIENEYYQFSPQLVNQQYKPDLIIWLINITDIHNELLIKANELEATKELLTEHSQIFNHLKIPMWYQQNNGYRTNKAFQELFETYNVEDFIRSPNKRVSTNIDGARRVFEIANINNKTNYGYALDITEIEHLRNEIKSHNQAYTEFLRSSSSAIAVYSDNMKLSNWNQAFSRLWGLEEQFLNQKPSYSEILEKLRQKRKLPEQLNFKEFKQQQIELFSNITETHNEFFYLPNNQIIRVVAIPHTYGGLLFAYEDISDRLALERSYNTIIDVLNTTFDNIHEAIAVFEQNGKLTIYNATFAKIWKLDKTLLSSNPHFKVINQSALPAVKSEQLIETLNRNISTTLELRKYTNHRFRIFDDTYIDRTVVPLPDGSVLVTDLDITDSTMMEQTLREANNALNQAHRIKNNFLANISYELRSPLTNIMGYTEILAEYYTPNKAQKEYLNNILYSTNYLIRLVDQIIDIGAINAGFAQLKYNNFNIIEAVQSIADNVNDHLQNFNQTMVTIKPASNHIALEADEIRIKQIIFNLLTNNNRNFSKNMLIYIDTEEDYLSIKFSNYFKFSSFDNLSLVINSSANLNEIDKHLPLSDNLGLGICKKFIDLHHGSIMLEQTNKNFVDLKLVLPLSSQAVESA